MYFSPFKNLFTPFYHTICDFSKKILTKKISKIWRVGKKRGSDLDSTQKIALEMMSKKYFPRSYIKYMFVLIQQTVLWI